jgi:hypothetical protein
VVYSHPKTQNQKKVDVVQHTYLAQRHNDTGPQGHRDTRNSAIPALLQRIVSSTRKEDMAEKMSIDKLDPTKDESEDSMDSSPEGDAPPTATTQENQQPKRKGGRKPVRFFLSFLSADSFTCQHVLTKLADLCDF